jgi:type IV pilus assembly protein PilF
MAKSLRALSGGRRPALIAAGAAILATGLLLAGACGPVMGTSPSNREASQRRYDIGRDYFSKAMWEPATVEALKAVEYDPQNADARNLLGVLLLQKGVGQLEFIESEQCIKGQAADMLRSEADGRFREAEVQFKAALAARPGDSWALHNLSLIAMHFKDYDTAIQNEQRALENPLYQDRHLARGELGWAYYRKGDHVHALKELLEAVRAEPRFCVGHYRLAQIYFDLAPKSSTPDEEYTNALGALERALSGKECRIQEAQYLKGLTHVKRRESAKAEQPFSDCVKMAPRSCLAAECRRYREMVSQAH